MSVGYLKVILTAGGGTVNIPAINSYKHIQIEGGATLTSSWTIQGSGSPVKGQKVIINYRAVMVFSGNNLTIYGKVIPSHLESVSFDAIAVYDGTVWRVAVKSSDIELNSIDGTSIVDASIEGDTKLQVGTVGDSLLADLPRGSMKVGDSSNKVSNIDVSVNANILIGDGSDVNAVAVTGDISIDNLGVSTIADGVVTEAKLSGDFGGELKVAEATLSQTEVNALFTTPKAVLSDPGPNNSISVVGVGVDYTFNGTAFVWGQDLQVQNLSGKVLAVIKQAILESGVSVVWYNPSIEDPEMIKGEGIVLKPSTSDPTGGGASSQYKLKIYYIKHTF